MAGSLLIRNVRPCAAQATDILVREGRIAALGSTLTADGVAVIDGAGRLALADWRCLAWSRPIPISTNRFSACPGIATKSDRG
jgi:hypothetical protein